MIPYKEGQFAVYRDRPDYRDFSFGDVAGAVSVDWDNAYMIDFDFDVESQNGSLSCVGQAFSKYAEVLNYYDTQEKIDLSAKFIYGQIYLPSGGAYLRDAAKILVKQGCAEESIVPSYPATEENMRNLVLNQDILDNAIKYQAKEYRLVSANIDELAQAIKMGHGVVTAFDGNNSGWQSAFVKPPQGQPSWSHAVYLIGYVKIGEKKYLVGINSWGEKWGDKGMFWVGEDYFQNYTINGINFNYAYQGWTIIDKPNNMIIKKEKGSPNYYLIINNKKIMIIDFPTYQALNSPLVEEVDSLSSYTDGGSLIWTERIIN